MNIKRALFLVLLWVFSLPSYAQVTKTARTTGAVGDRFWSDANDWVPTGVPASGDDIVIPSGVTMRVNLDNRVVRDATVEGLLVITDQRELQVNRNLVLNGDIRVDDNGNIESLGLVMAGAGGQLSGTGTFFTSVQINSGNTNPLFIFNNNVTIASSANLTFSCTCSATNYTNLVRINNNFVVTNNGRVTIDKSLVAQNSNSRWNNAASTSYLNVFEGMLPVPGSPGSTGILDASPIGNTVEYGGTANQTIISPTTATYHHLIASGSGTKTTAATLAVTGDLTISSILNLNGNNLSVAGNWANTGSFQAGSGSSAVLFNGAADQNITNSSGEIFNNLTVSKSGGSLLLNDPVQVNGTLNLANSRINTLNTVLTLGASTSQTGSLTTSGSSFIIGSLERWINTVLANTSFPLGTASGDVRTLVVNLNQLGSGGTILAQFLSQNPGGIVNPPLVDNGFDINNTHPTGFWRLTNDNGLTSNQYDVFATGGGFTAFPSGVTADTRLVSRSVGTTTWTASGAHDIGSFVSPTVRREDLALLPVELAFGENVVCVLPTAPTFTANPSQACAAATSIYTISAVANKSWEVVGGTITSPAGATGSGTFASPSRLTVNDIGQNSITVTWGAGGSGEVRVSETNPCGAGPQRTQAVTINPIATSAIAGLNSVSTNQPNVVYSVAAVAGYTYSWTVPSGGVIDGPANGSSVVVDWGATPGSFQVQVVATNTLCGLSAPMASRAVAVSAVKTNTGTGVGVGSPDFWSDAATWDPPGVPTRFDQVVIVGTDPVRVNIDNAEVGSLTINAGAVLEVGDQREINIYGNLTLNGTIEHLDNGNIESQGVAMVGNGTTLFGTGLFQSTVSINAGNSLPLFKFDANVTVDAAADLRFNATAAAYSNVVRVEANRIVSNFGKVTITRSLVGVDNSSTWVNKTGARLSVGDGLLTVGTLDARADGNTVEYSGSINQNIKLPINTRYGNLTVGGSAIKTLVGVTEVAGNLIINSNLNAATFNLLVGGNWTNQGVFQPGTGTVTFNGTGTQLIENASGETFGNLTVNKSGTVLQLNSDVTVSGTLTLQNSFVNTNSRVLTLGTSTSQVGTLVLASNPARILGKFSRWIAASGVNTVFPIGTSAFDRTLTATLNGLTTGGTLTVEFVSTTPSAISPIPLSDNTIDIYNIHPTGYWSIVKGNSLNLGASSYNVTLNAAGFDTFLPGTPLSNNTRIISRPNSSSPWTVNGNHGDTPGSFIAPVIKRNNLTLLSAELAIGENVGCILPLQPVISSPGGVSICSTSLTQNYSVSPTSTWVWEVVGGQITSPAGATGTGTSLNPSRLNLTSSNLITVLWNGPGSGTVRVAESNVCGIGAFGNYAVSINPIAPAAITGLNSVFVGQSDVSYSVSPLSGYTYTWTLPAGGGTIDGPSTGTSVLVDWGTTAGSFQIQVSASISGCGPSATTTLPVQIAGIKTNTGTAVGAGSPDFWSDANTWNPPGVPTRFDYVVIQGTDPVRLNIDNAEVGTLVINEGATLEIGDQREVNVYGDLTINGVISHLDNGNIESNGVAMVGNGTRLFGTGRFESIVAINAGNNNPLFKFDANVTIDATTDLEFVVAAPAYSNVVRIEANRIVTNLGKININRSLVGVDANSSVWINKTGSVLKVAESLLTTGRLDARESGNLIEYSGGSAQTIKLPVQSIYGSLTIGGSAVKTMPGALEVRNDLVITSNLNPNNFGLTLGGNWTNQGVFQEGSTTGSVTFNGAGNQLINTVSPEVFNILTVDKTGGEVRLTNNNIVISSSLVLSSGVLNSTSAYKVTVGTGFGSLAQLGTITAVAPARILGKLERFVRNSPGINNSSNLLFPIGTAASPRNFTVTFNDAPGTVAGSALLEFVESNPGTAGLPLTESSVTVFNTFNEGFWRITSANGLVSTNYSVNLLADGMTSFSIASARVVARANGASPWQYRGTHVPSSGLVAARNSVNLLSAEFALGDINNCTPAQTSAIIGSSSVCVNAVNSEYEAQGGLAGSTYTWDVVGGSITEVNNGSVWSLVSGTTFTGSGIRRIRVTWGAIGGTGSVQVRENNNFAPFFGCGLGPAISQGVTLNPVATSAITGAGTPSPGQTNEPYSVVNNPGYTYAWTVTGGTIASGAGTNAITVNWGTTPGVFTISVVATNPGCGSAAAVERTIEIINDVFNVNTADDFWNNPATWNVNRVPVPTDNVRIVNAGNSGAAVRLNVDNAAVSAFTVANGARFIIGDQRELNVSGNMVLDGTIDFNDNGNIESTGLAMVGNNTTLDGSGVFRTTVSINNGNSAPLFRFDANVTIPATANLQFTCTCTASDYTNLVRVDANRIVTNFGTVAINKSLVGVNNGSQWINRGGARLSVQDQILPGTLDVLDASESGNTVEYNGNALQTVKTPLTSYSNLRLAGSATKQLAASINVTGDVVITSNLTTSNNDLTVGGNWNNTGTFVQNTARVIIFNGAADQTITNPVGEVFQNMRVNKTTGRLLLANDVTVNGTLFLQQGYVFTQSSLFTLGNAGTEGALDLSSYVEGAFVGRFRRWADAFFPHTFLFPVGTSSAYRPLSLEFGSVTTGGATIVEFLGASPGTNGLPIDDAGYLVSNTFPEGFWRVSSPSPDQVGFDSYSARATADGFSSFAITAATRLLPRVDAASSWVVDGTHSAAIGNVVTRTSLTSFPYDLALGTNVVCALPATSAISLVSGDECINSSATYSVVNTPLSTYQWTVAGGTISSGQGSNEIVVTWGSQGGFYQIFVQENNSGSGGCGVGSAVTYSATVNPLSLGSISGNEITTSGAIATYSVANLPGYTYTWTVVGGTATPSTTNTVSITWGASGSGSVSVSAVGPCSVFTPVSSLTVTIFTEIVSALGCVSCPWNDAASWDPAIVPQPGSSVRIRGGTSVNLNVDNAIVSNLNVESGAVFNINDQRELTVNGNITLNGTVNFNDNGAIESLGLVMGASGGVLDGAGTFQTGVAINNGQTNPLFRFNANVTIAPTANLTFNCTCTASDYTNIVRVDANRIVTNFGRVTINRSLAGQNSAGQWINKAGAQLRVGRGLFPGQFDVLVSSETGNLVEYTGTVPQDIKKPIGSYFGLTLSGSNQKRINTASQNILGDLVINPGVTLFLDGWNLSFGGNFTNNGLFNSGGRTVTANGSSDQTINSASPLTFHTLIVNKPGGALNLSANVRATNALTLTQGNINTGTATLTLGTVGAANGTLTRTNGTIIGKFERTVLTTTPLGTSILFPVGTATQYRPATIAFDNLGGANGSLTVEFIAANPLAAGLPLNDGGSNVTNAFTEGYWDATATGITSTSYDLDLSALGFSSFTQNATNRILFRNNVAVPPFANWQLSGTHVAAAGTTIQRDNVPFGLTFEAGVGSLISCPAVNTSVISGPTDICRPSTADAYSVVLTPGSSYTWTVPDASSFTGGTSNAISNIVWLTGGVKTLQVVETSSCFEVGAPRTLVVNVHPIPVSSIAGNSTVVPNSVSQVYSVPFRNDYCYAWTVSGGTIASTAPNGSQITVDWGGGPSGNVQVVITYSADCVSQLCSGTSSQTLTLPINVTSTFVSTTGARNWSDPAAWVGGVVPPPNASVTISANSTITLTDNSVRVQNLTINSGTPNGILNNGTFLLTINGDYTNNGTHTGTGNTIITGSATGLVQGTGQKTQGTLTFNQSRTIVAGSNLSWSGAVLMNPNVTITNNATVAITNTGNLQGANDVNSIWVNGANATLNVGGTFNSGRINAIANNNLVRYSANANQNIRFPIGSPGSYFNLAIEGTGTKTMTGDITANTVTIASGATLATGPFILTINGDLNNSNVLTSTGTVIFTGPANPQIVGGTNTLTNLVINKPTGTVFQVANPATTTVSGELTVTRGEFELASSGALNLSGNVRIGAAGILDATNITNLTVGGDFIREVGGTFTRGSNTVTFNSASNRSINGVVTFHNLVKSGSGPLTLTNGNTTVANQLTLTTGLINSTISNLLVIGSGGSVTPVGGSASSYVNGPVRKDGNSGFVFPIGKAGIWARLAISNLLNTGPSDGFRAEYFAAAAPNMMSLGTGVVRVSNFEYWDLSRTSGSAQPQVTFHWEDDIRSAITETSTLLGVNFSSSTSRWENRCPCTTSGTANRDLVANTGSITTSNWTSFSPGGFGAATLDENPLPIQLLSFTGQMVDQQARLLWRTASEKDSDFFEIQRSVDGELFEVIGSQTAAGTSVQTLNYQYIDQAMLPGSNYYRLRMVDKDGSFDFSNVIRLENNNVPERLKLLIHPNPATSGTMQIRIQAPVANQTVFVTLRDLSGRALMSEAVEVKGYERVLQLQYGNELPAGIYLAEGAMGVFKASVRVAIVR